MESVKPVALTHEKVIPETYHLVFQSETALAKIGDDLFKHKQEPPAAKATSMLFRL